MFIDIPIATCFKLYQRMRCTIWEQSRKAAGIDEEAGEARELKIFTCQQLLAIYYLARCVSLPIGKELRPAYLMHHEASLVPVSSNSACANLVFYLYFFCVVLVFLHQSRISHIFVGQTETLIQGWVYIVQSRQVSQTHYNRGNQVNTREP